MVAALAGVFAMVVTNVFSPADAYDAVEHRSPWPASAGGTALFSELLVASADLLPLFAVPFLFTC